MTEKQWCRAIGIVLSIVTIVLGLVFVWWWAIAGISDEARFASGYTFAGSAFVSFVLLLIGWSP